jgi:hypothetical protein
MVDQKIEVDTKINIPVINFAKPEIIDITPENERIEPNRNEEQN